jgi:hypothetical protein
LLLHFYLLSQNAVILISNNSYFGTTNHAYGQMNSNVTNSLNIQNTQAKKVHVGDIDIAHKTFDKGDPILLIGGVPFAMDKWPPSLVTDLSSNHTVVIFDSREVGKHNNRYQTILNKAICK